MNIKRKCETGLDKNDLVEHYWTTPRTFAGQINPLDRASPICFFISSNSFLGSLYIRRPILGFASFSKLMPSFTDLYRGNLFVVLLEINHCTHQVKTSELSHVNFIYKALPRFFFFLSRGFPYHMIDGAFLPIENFVNCLPGRWQVREDSHSQWEWLPYLRRSGPVVEAPLYPTMLVPNLCTLYTRILR